MNKTIEALDKANSIIEVLLSDYGIFDIQNPTDDTRLIYSTDCGRIHALISAVSDYVFWASNELRGVSVNE
jgi:hypothetical protein